MLPDLHTFAAASFATVAGGLATGVASDACGGGSGGRLVGDLRRIWPSRWAGEGGLSPRCGSECHRIEAERFHSSQALRPSLTDPYMDFVRQTLDQYPRCATRLYQMIRERGYTGSVVHLRRTVVAQLLPREREPFLRLHTFPAEQAQVDWAHFGQMAVGRARRNLSCFVITLSSSRALNLEFFFNQTMENFLRCHVHAF